MCSSDLVAAGSPGPEGGIFGGQTKLFSDELANFANNAFKGVAGISLAGGLVFGDMLTALGAGTALFLHSKNKDAINIAKTAGLEVPKDQTDVQTLKTAAEVLKDLNIQQSVINEYLANDQFVSTVNDTISSYEKNLILLVDAQVNTADGQETAPLSNPQEVDKAYRDFMA